MTEKRFTFDEDVNEDDMYEMGVFSDNGKVMETIDVLTCLNNLHDENKQLKQRNTNQYNQLNKLWGLIQAKDWETLTAMKKQLKEDEERLQQEWKCYE